MRINSIPPKELYYQYVHVREKAQTPVTSNTGTDKIELSDKAKTFSAALKAAKEAMNVRSPEETKRIEQVAKQIKDQTYSVPGYKVAEKILGE